MAIAQGVVLLGSVDQVDVCSGVSSVNWFPRKGDLSSGTVTDGAAADRTGSMMIKNWAAAAAVGALMLSLPVTTAQATEARPAAVPQVAPTGAAVPVLEPATGPAPDNGGELLLLSNEEYTRRFGDRPSRTADVLVPPGPLAPTTAVLQDPRQPWHKVNWSVRDWDGSDIPTRHGTTDFGRLHPSSKHHMRS